MLLIVARLPSQLWPALFYLLTGLAFSTRFYNLSVPAYVCWDETHFGKMGGLYLNRTYFVDVHPPLGKMIIAAAGYMTGYDGRFDFASPGDEYVKGEGATSYYGMRALSATLGSLVIPLVFGTVETMTQSKDAAVLTSVLLIFDCGFITLSQYILLDPLLLFFMAATVYFSVKFISLNHRKVSAEADEFSATWWFFLIMSGISLGCMVATKWIGLFTVMYVGILTITNLWNLLGYVEQVSMACFLNHFVARLSCLVLLPLVIYCGVFWVHYKVLDRSGTVDGHHSSMFQTCLRGNELHNVSLPLQVAYGSLVTLKHHRITASGYLHSHDKVYPPKVLPYQHRQVTVYFHKDGNNYWEIVKPPKLEFEPVTNEGGTQNRNHEKVEFLKDGDIIKLKHALTGFYLHSHLRSAPLSPRQQIVSSRDSSSPDGDDELWRVELVGENEDNDHVMILTSLIRLVHVKTGCALLSSTKMLPSWGGHQFEVTCSSRRRDRIHAVWNIEYHINDLIPRTKIVPCTMSFGSRFVESHLVMAIFNSQMKTNDGERTSKPWHWPLNYKGQAFSRMGEKNLRVYLLGNPLVYWTNLLVIIFFSFLTVLQRILKLRSYPSQFPSHEEKMRRCAVGTLTGKESNSQQVLADLPPCFVSSKWFLVAWGIHYLPFYLMSRVLYFHHYYPAFVFNCCLTGSFVDFVFKAASCHLADVVGRFTSLRFTERGVNRLLNAAFVIAIVRSFYLYSPLCYGMSGPYSHKKDAAMHGLKIFRQWEI